ncbi:AAA family ATPase [Phenylobacterium sp.]|uniref:AAA family ATPase n=1 Tax=Phenylobacterium sp. TaxID=1871053 RepID=UPI002FDA6C53
MTATIHVIFGPQGAGKSTYARDLARRLPAVGFAIDDWMGRLFGPDMPEPLEFDWMMERVERCEAQIWSTAAAVLATGGSVILDLGLMRRSDRQRVADIAAAVEIPVQFHFVDAPVEVRRERVLGREEVAGEGFRLLVTPEMFHFTEKAYEAPDEVELRGCVISTSA